MLGGYGLRTVLRAELNRNGSADLTPVDTRALPSLDVVVAARDEEGVVTRLVERLTSLRYPADRLTTWVIDDGSQDRTPQLLDELAERHPSLQVIHRERRVPCMLTASPNVQHPRGDPALEVNYKLKLHP